jgi:hypothetical protein
MTRRILKSFGPVTLIDARIYDNPYLVTGPSGDRSFDDMASAETYFLDESLRVLNSSEPAGETPMDLQTTIMDVLRSSGQALTFEDVVKCVAQKLEGDIRVTLNELVAQEQILVHVGARNHRWRYQARRKKRRF